MTTPTPQLSGAQVDFAPGAMIFEQGSPGGDLYLLKSGEVEVFRASGGVEVRLATLRQGEILGIMTCLTREPRLASARALTEVKALVVKQAGFKTLISSTPAWVHTVIKDFIIRIKNMDDLYAKAVERLEKQDRDVSMVWVASAIASGLGEVGSMLTSADDHPRLVDIDQVLVRLAKILDTPLAQLQQVFAVFVETGILKVDPKTSSRKAELAVLERMAGFTEFCRKYLGQKDVRLALEGLDGKDAAALIGIYEVAKASGKEMARVPAPDPGLAKRAAVAKLVEFDAAAGIVSFVPQHLINAVRYLLVIQKTRGLSKQMATAEGHDRHAVQVIAESF